MAGKMKSLGFKTEGLTAEEVQAALDLAVAAGARAREGVEGLSGSWPGKCRHDEWQFAGVDLDNDTYLSDEERGFGEIVTYTEFCDCYREQAKPKAWMPEVGQHIEWLDDNGTYLDCEVVYLSEWVIVLSKQVDILGEVSVVEISYDWSREQNRKRVRPVETAEQKAEREREEGISKLYAAFAGTEVRTPDYEQVRVIHDWLKAKGVEL